MESDFFKAVLKTEAQQIYDINKNHLQLKYQKTNNPLKNGQRT